MPLIHWFSLIIHLRSRTAICRGAIFKGFLDDSSAGGTRSPGALVRYTPIEVTSTISRANYGIKFYEAFDGTKHSREDQEWDDSEGQFIANNQMNWYLKRGSSTTTFCPHWLICCTGRERVPKSALPAFILSKFRGWFR